MDISKGLSIPLGPRKKLVKLFASAGLADVAATATAATTTAAAAPAGASADPCDTAAKFSAGRAMIVGKPGAAARGIWHALGVKEGGERCLAILRDGVGEIRKEFTTLGEHCDEKDKADQSSSSEEQSSLSSTEKEKEEEEEEEEPRGGSAGIVPDNITSRGRQRQPKRIFSELE